MLRCRCVTARFSGRTLLGPTGGPISGPDDIWTYGKDIHLSQFMPEAWDHLNKRHPEILKASSCKHLVFETPDPEMWVSHGYIIVKVDSRGSGKSAGKLDVNSPAEF